MKVKIECTICDGTGRKELKVYREDKWAWIPCKYCNGHGYTIKEVKGFVEK
jgi:DnaJ-class molecular chaperone